MLRKKGYTGFFGRQMYDQIVPKNHYLKKVNELINWIKVVEKILPSYKGQFTLGASAISPVTMFKMMFLSFLYNRSDREIEVMCDDTLSMKYFIEIAVDEKSPDHSSLSRFRTRIIKHFGNEKIFEEMFTEILSQILKKSEIEVGEIQIIDAKHMNGRVSEHRKNKRTKKDKEADEEKNKEREKEGKKIKDYRSKEEIDPEAGFGCKGYKNQKDKEGNKVSIGKWFYGYKANCSIENKNDFITSCILSSGNRADGEYFEGLMWKDIERRGKAKIYTADKGYDWGDNHYWLNILEIGDAIILQKKRLIKDKLHAMWHKIFESEEYKKGKAERYKVERTFGDMYNNLGIHNCRYFGKLKTSLQMFMTAMAYNVKKAMKVLHKISLREPVKAILPVY